MLAAALGDFDILKQLYDAKNKKVFRKGDRFCDLRRQRVRFMRSWRAATCKPMGAIPSLRERQNVAAVLIQDMVRTTMERRGLWHLPVPFGHVVDVESTKFGDKMTIEYDDDEHTRETNFLMEFQHLDLLVSIWPWLFLSSTAAVTFCELHPSSKTHRARTEHCRQLFGASEHLSVRATWWGLTNHTW